MKGLFLPEITTEDFRDGCLESIEALIGEGEIYDIDYSEPCEDCISRQALLDATVKKNSVWNSITNSKGENLEEIVLQLSSVQPKVKTGHWIVDRETSRLNIRCKQTFDYSVHCDKCYYPCDYTTDVKGSLPSNYCPDCGAKMVGLQESEE